MASRQLCVQLTSIRLVQNGPVKLEVVARADMNEREISNVVDTIWGRRLRCVLYSEVRVGRKQRNIAKGEIIMRRLYQNRRPNATLLCLDFLIRVIGVVR